MPTTIEAIINEKGNVFLQSPVRLSSVRRALVIILEEEPVLDIPVDIPETALLSEPALGEDWNRPEEDEAWGYLQQVPLS